MSTRKEKIETLLTDFRSLRRAMALSSAGSARSPRITPSQWGVLLHVEHCRTSTVKDVSRALGITSSAATQLVTGLVDSGYLTRKTSPEDRRTVTLALSKKSKKHIDRMKQQVLQKFLKLFAVLSDREFDTYFALNQKIVRASLSKTTSL